MKFERNRPHASVGVALTFLLVLTQITSSLAGMACYPACTVACCECAGGPAAFAGPLGIAVGVTGCAGICMVACATLVWAPPACFANDTSIAVSAPDGKLIHKPISAVQIDDQVVTLVNGQPITTRVVRNIQSNGNFDFFEFEVRSNNAIDITTLKVTPQHAMIVQDHVGEMGFSLPGDVNVGTKMLWSDGTVWEVSRIRRSVGSEKFTLVTAEGSVLASGLLVSTICDEEITTGRKMDDVMQGWKQRHNPTTLLRLVLKHSLPIKLLNTWSGPETIVLEPSPLLILPACMILVVFLASAFHSCIQTCVGAPLFAY